MKLKGLLRMLVKIATVFERAHVLFRKAMLLQEATHFVQNDRKVAQF
ncbi:MAG: hypothetical protein K0Q74_1137 [Gammaproteobacteria bacterium]|jgi:hypothetical protein|nr:hypothetical protein [Gammaproteobacteria bacterium]